MNKILWAIKWRTFKYNIFWLSRHEYKKFWITENRLRLIIETFKKEWLIEIVEKKMLEWHMIACSVFKATDKLLSILDYLRWWIDSLSYKIKQSCKNINIESFFMSIWLQFNSRNKKLIDHKWRINYKSKISYNKNLNIITDWKEWKTYNLYNFCRDIMWYCTRDINLLFNIN
jgi:hypothetical protein